MAIVVDLEEKTEQDRALLRKLAIESEMENSMKSTLEKTSFGLSGIPAANRISLNINHVSGRKQNSYLKVIKIYEFRVVMQVALI